jgi:tetratricopeptide (TPR) repeat protein
VTRFLTLLVLIAAAAEAAPARAEPAPAPAPQMLAIARNCSLAINGDVTNSNILICPVVAILMGIADIAGSQDVDPLLLQLIRQESFDEALRRVERLVAGGVEKPIVYLSIGASLAAARGRPEEALSFAKRAYEADPADSMLLLRYYAALSANRRADEAAALIASADRRRAELKGVGQHLLDVAKLELEFPYERLNPWRESLDRCLSPGSGPPRAARARDRRAARCALDPALQQSLRALRERALRIEQGIAAAEPGARMPLQTRHYLLQYVLVADELLQDPAQAARTEWRMTELGREILKRFGPWVYMLTLQSDQNISVFQNR